MVDYLRFQILGCMSVEDGIIVKVGTSVSNYAVSSKRYLGLYNR